MRLELFNDGTAMFTDKTAADGDFKIEVNGEGYLHVGSKVHPIKDGVATVKKLPEGDYSVSVAGNKKVYHAYEHIHEDGTGHATVDDSHLWEIVLDLKEDVQNLLDKVTALEKKTKEHEERISGYALFGN